MYDEATRQQDHYWASLAYAQEEDRAEGIEQAVISLMKNGYISPKVVAEKLNISIDELNRY